MPNFEKWKKGKMPTKMQMIMSGGFVECQGMDFDKGFLMNIISWGLVEIVRGLIYNEYICKTYFIPAATGPAMFRESGLSMTRCCPGSLRHQVVNNHNIDNAE